MSMKSLIVGIGKLTVSCAVQSTKSSTTGIISRILINKPIVGVFGEFPNNRPFSTSTCLERRLDSRKYPHSRVPSSRKERWVETKPFSEMYEYTTEPLPFPKTGGRGPNGRIWNHRRGGGKQRFFRMVDWNRGGPDEGPPLEERVYEIIEDKNRSARLALVASENHKRLIIATQNMKPGDIIRSSRELTSVAVRPKEGDSHPLGSLPIGTVINCVELHPGEGGRLACAAGVASMLIRKMGDKCVVRMPSKREVMVSNQCVATVGRVGNIDHDKQVWGKAGAKRNAGFRPRSGLWHRKTGRFGRKIRAIKPMVSAEYKKGVKTSPKLNYFSIGSHL